MDNWRLNLQENTCVRMIPPKGHGNWENAQKLQGITDWELLLGRLTLPHSSPAMWHSWRCRYRYWSHIEQKSRAAQSPDTISRHHYDSLAPTSSLLRPVITSPRCHWVSISQNKCTANLVGKVELVLKASPIYSICLFFHSLEIPLSLGQIA